MARISDKIADDLVDRQISVLRAAEGLSQKIIAEFEKAENAILAKLNRMDLTSFTRQRTIEALNQVRRIAAEFSKTAYETMRNDSSKIAQLVASRTAGDLNDLFNVDVFNPTLSANSIKRILDDNSIIGGQTAKDYWSRQPNLITDAYSQVIRTGLVTGASKADMLKQVVESDKLALTKGQIKTMVRTSVMEVANSARLDMYRDNNDLVKGIVWLSTLDSRTSAICRGLDGLTWTLDYKPIGHTIPFPGSTAHYNCRSTQLPLLRSFAELAGKNEDLAAKLDDAMSKGTRASMDGQVPKDLTYNDWLKTKSKDFAIGVLGPARYELWQSGELSMRDMLSQSGNSLTIPELETALEPKFLSGPKRFSSPSFVLEEEAEELYKELLAFKNHKMGAVDVKAINDYIAGSGPINAHLRDGLFPDLAEPVSSLRHAISTMTPNTKEMRLWRGTEIGNFDIEVGDYINVEGFLSTSYDKFVGDTFYSSYYNEIGDDAVLLDIRVPPGLGRFLPGSNSERELIMDHGTRLRVVGQRYDEYEHDGGELGMQVIKRLIIEVEVVP